MAMRLRELGKKKKPNKQKTCHGDQDTKEERPKSETGTQVNFISEAELCVMERKGESASNSGVLGMGRSWGPSC